MTENEAVDHIGTVMLNCIKMNKPLPDRFLDAAEHFVRMAGFSKWCQKIVIDAIDEQRRSNSLLKREDEEQ
jgi:pantoate kinase